MRNSLLIAAILAAAAGGANATVVQLTFEGVGDLQAVGNFYNGGAGGALGVSFSGPTLGLVDADAGGHGNFANEPTSDTIMFFLDENSSRMTVAGGFTTGFSFYYSSFDQAGSVSVYDGPDGTGNLLASIALAGLGSAGNGDPTGFFDTWAAVGVLFNGTAQSVVFAGAANYIGFDNITFGSDNPNTVPVPAAGLMTCAGLMLVGSRRRR